MPGTFPTILVVAATNKELTGAVDLAGAGEAGSPTAAAGSAVSTRAACRITTLCCGVGPVEAAAATGAAIARERPALVLHVGIAGARRASGITPVSLVIGSEAVYCDLAASNDWAPRTMLTAAALVEAARRALPDARALPIGTSARVGGTTGCDVEAMEGFAVLRAAQLAGVPAIEVRAVSNEIEEADRSRWRFDEAFRAVADATPRLIAELAACVN
jgi:nucleoside phosphorylase